MFYKKFLKFSFLIILLLCIGAVNAADMGDNITEININENLIQESQDNEYDEDSFLESESSSLDNVNDIINNEFMNDEVV